MKLLDYLKETSTEDEACAAALGCSVFAVRKWKYGERIPRKPMIELIQRWSGGKVAPSDWYAPVVIADQAGAAELAA